VISIAQLPKITHQLEQLLSIQLDKSAKLEKSNKNNLIEISSPVHYKVL
jgi:hypothetical protein